MENVINTKEVFVGTWFIVVIVISNGEPRGKAPATAPAVVQPYSELAPWLPYRPERLLSFTEKQVHGFYSVLVCVDNTRGATSRGS